MCFSRHPSLRRSAEALFTIWSQYFEHIFYSYHHITTSRVTLTICGDTLAGMTPLSAKQCDDLLQTLKERFEKHLERHKGVTWNTIEAKLAKNAKALETIAKMEATGGEPDVVVFKKEIGFWDCAAESPKGRRSFCYDRLALNARKENKPKDDVMSVAKEMGIELLDEERYRHLQTLGEFDAKTSSWLLTPKEIRQHGGAIFGDCRYKHVFIYHNGADSYYAARGFRGGMTI